MATTQPTQEELEDIILSARFGEVDEIKAFGERFGWPALAAAKDDRGNTALHMACGNGHIDVVKLLIEHIASPATLSATNSAGSPPTHWAIMNNHLACVQALVEVPEANGGGIQLLKEKNSSGRDAFAEALFAGEGKEEVAGWIEGYLWKIEGGDELEGVEVKEGADGELTVRTTSTDEVVPDKDEEGSEDEAVAQVAAKTEELAVKEDK